MGPFAVNGSRGRNNNFIIDSVDNNEPLFGGAAARFTNTDLFGEFRIYTSAFKAEYGRNSGYEYDCQSPDFQLLGVSSDEIRPRASALIRMRSVAMRSNFRPSA